jgi:chromosome partitioning protein
MVLNAKGGCGKSTLSTNIAVFFAREGQEVCIADYDPQRSSLDWLAQRPSDLPRISGVPAYEEGLRGVPRATEVLVIDAPARVHGVELNELVRRAETIIISWRNCWKSARCPANRPGSGWSRIAFANTR